MTGFGRGSVGCGTSVLVWEGVGSCPAPGATVLGTARAGPSVERLSCTGRTPRMMERGNVATGNGDCDESGKDRVTAGGSDGNTSGSNRSGGNEAG
jgi:hypothetical protein